MLVDDSHSCTEFIFYAKLCVFNSDGKGSTRNPFIVIANSSVKTLLNF